MTYSTLQEFVEALDSAGELQRIKAQVSPMLEISAIADKVSKSPAARPSEHAHKFDPNHANLGGKALLFENVEGSEFPLLINGFGSYRRMEMALGCEDGGFESVGQKIENIVKPQPPTGWREKVGKGLEMAKLAALSPKVVKNGDCQQVVKTGGDVNLFDLPIIKCWPDDGDPTRCGYSLTAQEAGTAQGQGRYITFGGMYTIHPDDANKPEGQPRQSRNIGMYRAQLIDKNHTAMHWHIHHDGAQHWSAWKKIGKPMPLAICFGGQSVLPYSATAPLPPGISELLFAGLLNEKSIPLVRCKTVDMHVPANSEIVIEGTVSTEAGFTNWNPNEKDVGKLGAGAAFEGPFGDHTGFYSLPDRYPIFEISAITHKKNPIYPTTIVGLPPQEDYYLGKATERLFLPLLKTIVPDIIDYHLPMFGAFHNCAFVKIKKAYPLHARKVMHAIWGAGQMAWTKMIVVVDEQVNVHDEQAVLFHLCANMDPKRDIEIVNGPVDILDHAAPRLGAGHKIGFDATPKIKGEEAGGHPVRDWPKILSMPKEINELIKNRWQEYGFN